MSEPSLGVIQSAGRMTLQSKAINMSPALPDGNFYVLGTSLGGIQTGFGLIEESTKPHSAQFGVTYNCTLP